MSQLKSNPLNSPFFQEIAPQNTLKKVRQLKNPYKKKFKNYQDFSQKSTSEEEFSFEKNSFLKYKVQNDTQKNKNKAMRYGSKYKTQICKNMRDIGFCKFGQNCCFAHTQEELRVRQIQTKTISDSIHCKKFSEVGFCQYSINCQFEHDQGPCYFQQLLNNFAGDKFINLQSRFSDNLQQNLLNGQQSKHQRLNVFSKLVTQSSQELQLIKQFIQSLIILCITLQQYILNPNLLYPLNNLQINNLEIYYLNFLLIKINFVLFFFIDTLILLTFLPQSFNFFKFEII